VVLSAIRFSTIGAVVNLGLWTSAFAGSGVAIFFLVCCERGLVGWACDLWFGA
jgi:hypothetical protein